MTEIQAHLSMAIPNATTGLFGIEPNHSTISQAQVISPVSTKNDISGFIVASPDPTHLVNSIQNLKDISEISKTAPGSIPALSKLTLDTNNSPLGGTLGPQNEQDTTISPTLPQTSAEAKVNTTMVHKNVDEPVRSPLISVLRESDHLTAEYRESSYTAGSPRIGEEAKLSDQHKPKGYTLMSIDNARKPKPVQAVEVTTSASSSDGSLAIENREPTNEAGSASLSTHTTTERKSSPQLDPLPEDKPHISPTIPEGTTPSDYPHTGTTADFYRVDMLAWEHFTSVASSNLTTWVNSYYYSGPPPVTKTTRANDAERPTVVAPLHVDELVHGREDGIRKGRDGKTMPAHSGESTGKCQQPRISLFDRSKYPAPWPLIPYSQRTCQYLNHQIPHRSLPKTLIVHDPWNLLAVDSSNEHGETKKGPYRSWMEHEDIIHTYDLKLSPEAQARIKDEDSKTIYSSAASTDSIAHDTPGEEPKEDEEDIFMISEETETGVKLTVDGAQGNPPGYLFYPEDMTPGPIYPPIFVIFDLPSHESQPADPSLQKIDKAHLYVGPTDWIGYGNHSCVVEVELELPRPAIIRPSHADYRPKLCVSCIKNDLKARLESLDGKNGERMSERWREKRATSNRIFLPDNNGDPRKGRYMSYVTGPLRPIRITLRPHDYNAKQCQYSYPPPPSIRVRVMAKLSNVGDDHLDREAANYQAFPQHMFEHRTDTYKMPNETVVVPMGAVVPQFYGYYAPREQNTDGADVGDWCHRIYSQYLSRILLLEDCGRQMSLDELTPYERKTCASLVARFHDAGWSHESVYRRNFVRQAGPLSIRLSQRTGSIFRLVDFGRSFHNASGVPSPSGCASWKASREVDEKETEEMFGVSITRRAVDVDKE